MRIGPSLTSAPNAFFDEFSSHTFRDTLVFEIFAGYNCGMFVDFARDPLEGERGTNPCCFDSCLFRCMNSVI